MTTFDDIEEFRRSPEAMAFASAWLAESKSPEACCAHMTNLAIWQKSNPHQALGIILNLIDQVKEDEEVAEMIATGPATEIVESTAGDFTPILQQAISTYPMFALCTKWHRENSADPRWARLSKA